MKLLTPLLPERAPLIPVTNVIGRVEYIDHGATNSGQRFYRAVKP